MIETLLAFSIFVSIIVLFVSIYNSAATKSISMTKEYSMYQKNMQIKEQQICLDNPLIEVIQQVLP